MAKGICCQFCVKFEKPECPVKTASPWSRWQNYCGAYQPNPLEENSEVLKESALSFSEALYALKEGYAVQRKGWNGKGMWIAFQHGYTENRLLPFLMMRTADNSFVPWTASQTDILAEDWRITERT